MPQRGSNHAALAERNRLLSQTKIITLGIAGGAAIASLGLGTAFAHDIPGHSRTPAVPARSPSSPSSPTSSSPARRHHRPIAPPARPPAPAPSSPPAPVTSGGT